MTSNMRWAAMSMALVLSGCAGFKVVDDVDPDNSDLPHGIRYYEPAPFLLVYSDGKGNLSSQIIMMPDTQKRRVIDLYAYASSNNSTLDFSNGMLTKSVMALDTTTVPSTLLKTIQTLGVEAISAAFNAPQSGVTHAIPAPYLYKIVVNDKGTYLVGGQGLGPDGNPLVLMISVTKEAASDSKVDGGGEPTSPTKGSK
jgi:hypothetical protein